MSIFYVRMYQGNELRMQVPFLNRADAEKEYTRAQREISELYGDPRLAGAAPFAGGRFLSVYIVEQQIGEAQNFF